MPPAVERMEQAHRLFFMVRGAVFHNGTCQNLQKPAAYGIYHNGKQKPGKGAGEYFRQDSHKQKSCCTKNVGCQHRALITDFINKARGQQVYHKLYAKVKGDKQRNLRQGNIVGALKGQKQKRCKIIDNCLYDVGSKAGEKGFVIIFCLRHKIRLRCHPASSGAVISLARLYHIFLCFQEKL